MTKKDESFLLLSLSDSKGKKIAQAVNNETCRKILDYLSKTDNATETKIANDLNIPLPTVHYNLSQLVDVKLVDIDEFHYSEKGKEVNHYSLANKYIIIAPKNDANFLDKLRNILPAFGIIAFTSITIKIVEYLMNKPVESASTFASGEAAPQLMMAKMADTAPVVTDTISSSTPDIALWFFIGATSALFVYTIVDWVRKK